MLKGTHMKFTGQLGADPADDLKIRELFRSQEDSAEHLPLDASVEMFHEFSIRQTRVRLQEHQSQFIQGTEVG